MTQEVIAALDFEWPAKPKTAFGSREKNAYRARIKALLAGEKRGLVWLRTIIPILKFRHWRKKPEAVLPTHLRWRVLVLTTPAKTLIVAGVRFMGETAKILTAGKKLF